MNASRLKTMLAWYNMIPNLIWSVLNLVPVTVFCYNFVDRSSLYTFIAISILPVFFPNSFFDKIQLGKTTAIYKKLGVDLVNKLAQNGDIINKLIRKKFPGYKAISYQRSSINKLLQQTYIYEKFHFVMFVFFCLVMAYALIKTYPGWAVIVFVCNLFYNVYPNLLQQYIRVKLMLYKEKLPRTDISTTKPASR